MDLKRNAEERAFRDEVRSFLAAELPADIRTKVERNLPIAKGEQIGWQKILHATAWTPQGQLDDQIFRRVRRRGQGKPQEGISFLLTDMRTPGISLSPLITIDGGHHVNQVFFQDVRVPAANLVGEENKGWTYAKFLL